MKKLRSIFVLGLVLILTTMATVSSALPKTALENEKVQLLNDLKIFTGSNGDYRLNDKLARSEASALAVRILGKELHVLVNAASYRKTKYPDVDASQWYASYVGYCTEQGILSGDTAGNYNPNDFITEKSFIKIILGVLGYEYNIDFTWASIYKKAFEVGLVTDLLYIAKEEDNINFTRRAAVNIMYNALFLKTKNTESALFNKLIDGGIITTEEAVEFGLLEEELKDEIVTEIDELIVFDQNNITILFNEDVKSIDQIKIYQANNEDKMLAFGIEEKKDGYVVLKTEKQTPGLEYTIEIRTVEDLYGNVQDELYGAFIGFMRQTVESDFFRIQKIEPINEKSINIYFTHPVNINTENPLYYRISNESFIFASGEKDQLLLRAVTAEDSCVQLTLKNSTFNEGEQYRIEINGCMTSAYGVKLNDGYGDEMAFKAVAGQADSFVLLEVVPYESNVILLSFNKEVNPFLAQQVYNYYVTDKDQKPIAIESVTLESQGLRVGEIVYLQLKESMKRNGKYYVTINNLNDITRQEFITERTYSFEADYGFAESLDIVDVTPKDRQTVEVYFSNMLDPSTAEIVDYYPIALRNGTTTVYPRGVRYDRNIHPYRVTLFFNDNDLEEKREYELKVSFDIKDYLGNKAGATLRRRFHASDVEKIAPSIEEVTPISTNAVKLVTNKELAFTIANLQPSNYTLEYNYQGMGIKEVPLSVLYINAKTLVLMFDKLDYEMPYTLRINAIVDFSGTVYKVTGEGKNYVDFILEEQE